MTTRIVIKLIYDNDDYDDEDDDSNDDIVHFFLNSPIRHPLNCSGETSFTHIGNPELIREVITITITI